jgi:hypothetical protein
MEYIKRCTYLNLLKCAYLSLRCNLINPTENDSIRESDVFKM